MAAWSRRMGLEQASEAVSQPRRITFMRQFRVASSACALVAALGSADFARGGPADPDRPTGELVLPRNLTPAEIEYLVRHEWAASADDILWRRSKLGLHIRPETRSRLEAWLAAHPAPAAAAEVARPAVLSQEHSPGQHSAQADEAVAATAAADRITQDNISLPRHLTGLAHGIWLRLGDGDKSVLVGVTPGPRVEAETPGVVVELM